MRSFLFLVLFFITVQSQGSKNRAPGSQTRSKTEKTEKTKIKKKKIGVDQSDFMPDANSFGVITSYSVSFNQLEEENLKTYNHRLSFAGTYSFDKHWSSYLALSATHQAYDNKIVRDNDNDPYHELSNVNLGLVYSKMAPLSFIQRSSNTLNIGLPISRRSQVDEHISNLSFTNFIQTYSWKRFSLYNRFSGNFLWQTQRFSPFMNDQLNRDWLISNSFGLNFMALQRLGFRFNYRANSVRFLDGTWNLDFGDNLSVFANYFGFQFFASIINNSYQENERIDLGYYDKYRRVFLAGATYVF